MIDKNLRNKADLIKHISVHQCKDMIFKDRNATCACSCNAMWKNLVRLTFWFGKKQICSKLSP